MRRFILTLLLGLSIVAYARVYKLEGMVGGKYPIVIELEEHDDGLFSGRYAYQSTLRKNGNFDCSWLDINPSYENPISQWCVRDCDMKPVETWYNVKFSDGKHLTARMKNAKGKTYNIAANVTAYSQGSPTMTAYFKEHIGDYASDFGMFFDPSIQDRLENLMGDDNYNYMTTIYQVQVPIEYHNGMYYGSGFMVHQCCDPATVWAYDTDNNSFYIWIRKDAKDYWWAESGNIPFKFQELVNERY